jgi:hypothetical protein
LLVVAKVMPTMIATPHAISASICKVEIFIQPAPHQADGAPRETLAKPCCAA